MRFIPRKTKVKMEFFKGVTLTDILVAAIGVGGAFFFAISNLPYHWYFALAWICIIAMLFMPVDDELKLYGTIGLMIRFIAFKKKYNKDDIDKKTGKLRMREIIPYEGIIKDKFLDYKDYFGMVMEIQPIEFGLLDDNKQEMVVKSFANALRRLTPEQSASIIKTNKAIVFDDYVQCEDKKYDTLMELQYEGEMTEEEVQARADVFEARVSQIEYMNREEKIYKDYFYIIVYDKDKELLESTIDGMINTIGNSVVPMNSHKLIGKELAAFLRSTYGKDFDERDLESTPVDQFTNWSMPESIVFKTQKTVINKQAYRSFVITDYPLQVPNAWGAHFFMIGGTNVVMNIKQQQKGPAERKIDRAIVEMEAKMANTLKSSKKLEQQTQLKTMKELLATLKSNNEQLFEMNTHILCEEGSKKEVRALLRQNGYKFSEMFGRQVDAFVSRNMSALDTVKNSLRDIPTTTLASVFPFISGALQDEKGFYIGYNEYPVFVNFFKRDRERANSNVMIIGKSGGGKSYATKTLLTNLACDNSKVFVLDPEDEYTPLSYNMKGKVMDVGSSMSGRFNPFHIFTTLQSDEGGEDDSYSVHLQFLEEFLSIILPGMPAEAFELLNAIVIEAYKEKGINSQTPLTKLKATDFPIFDDIYRLAQNRLKNAQDEYFRNNIQSVITYISKFATGGRNSNLWNGPTSIETKENFFTFNFRSLLANRNSLVANAQMLLVFKYLDNEIIKNKDFNDKYSANRHIIVVVDEAHVFINPQRPIAMSISTFLERAMAPVNAAPEIRMGSSSLRGAMRSQSHPTHKPAQKPPAEAAALTMPV